jgi:transcriptional regulator GlxA family with amidase domain
MSKRIAILGYDGAAAINVVGPLEAFSIARTGDDAGNDEACYRVSTIACAGTQFVSDTGVTFQATRLAEDDQEPFDTIIIPGGSGMLHADTCAEVSRWVMVHATGARRIASICTGVYALASTGLIDGRRVTTHWERAREVSQRFPKLKVEESALFLKDGKFYTSAGATAGIDLSLALIAEDFGQEVALRVARRLLVYLARDGGQEQYSEPARFDVDNEGSRYPINLGRMGSLMRWITTHLGEDLRLDKLAKRALLTKQDFVLQFTETFGVPPGLFVKNLRFNEARRRLAEGEDAADIAKGLGFRCDYFIQEFRRRYGALPDEYQRRFRSVSAAPETEGLAPSEGLSTSSSNAPGNQLKSSNYQRPRIVSFTRCVRSRVVSPELQTLAS